MASELQYFYEDEVFRLNKKGFLELGMVLRNSEHMSSDEDDSEYEGTVKNGYIRVAWHPGGVQQVLQERKVGLADRSLMPGDVVRRLIKGKDTQRGYCRDIRVKADVQLVGSKQIITNVDSKELLPIERFVPGVAVVLRSWVGTVKTVKSRLHLSLPDGSRCTMADVDADDLEILEDPRLDSESSYRKDFHPGQIFFGTLQDLQDVNWIIPPKESKKKLTTMLKMVIEDVEAYNVVVHWQYSAYSAKQEQPPTIVAGDDLKILKPLNVFESCTLQIGDRSIYLLVNPDASKSFEAWRYQQEWALFARKAHWKRKGTENPKLKLDEDKTGKPGLEQEPKPNNEEWETDEGDTASVSSGCSSNSSAGGGGNQRKKKYPGLMTKMLKYKKLRRTRRKPPNVVFKPNSKVVVEVRMTSSCADVVWQDGSVEKDIPSTQLYPIHHLDDQEFFPGDFVVENKDSGCIRMYGVVQSVDHVGRLAKVTWFHTYTSNQETEPKKLETVEVSVYDLKDHPDFQYRPGTVALRVANFDGENETSSVGQVLDNYPEGRVHMWWVDGRTSMCWPQDLYKVGDYDSDEGELWEDNGSDESWETESEEELQEETLKPKLAVNIEKARVSMSRLEELFTHNPGLQTVAIMQKLLEVYRDCRYLDKLMGTFYFHEKHFQGLLERVREKNRSSLVGQRISDQVSRLSAPLECNENSVNRAEVPFTQLSLERVNETLKALNDIIEQKIVTQTDSDDNGEKTPNSVDDENKTLFNLIKSVSENGGGKSPISVNGSEKSPNSVNSGPLVQSTSQDDSGVFEHSAVSADASPSENCDCLEPSLDLKKGTYIFGALGSRTSYGGCEKRVPRLSKHLSVNSPPGHQNNDCADDSNPCAKLCALIKAQLCLACGDVFKRFYGENAPPRLSEVERPSPGEGEQEAPSTPGVDEIPQPLTVEGEGFEVITSAPSSHKFRLGMTTPDAIFLKTVRKELALLRNALPSGIWVKGYEDRMDLYSIMIRGPEKTPYEDGLFLFDALLPRDYPRAPPIFHYHSYCSDRLNPNLYEDGKVCVSLLGTWKGRGTEVWTHNSTLLQVIVSIQGLILVKEPYYNEAGYEKQKGSQQGHENSRMYNEMAVLKLVQAMTKLSHFPHPDFQKQIKLHFAQNAERLIQRVEKWLDISEKYNENIPVTPETTSTETDARARNEHWQQSEINIMSTADQPDFPLLPASRGFCITMRKTLEAFRTTVTS